MNRAERRAMAKIARKPMTVEQRRMAFRDSMVNPRHRYASADLKAAVVKSSLPKERP